MTSGVGGFSSIGEVEGSVTGGILSSCCTGIFGSNDMAVQVLVVKTHLTSAIDRSDE